MTAAEVIGKAKDFLGEHTANLSAEDKVRVYDEVRQWCQAEAVKAEQADPDRIRNATARGAQALQKPEQ